MFESCHHFLVFCIQGAVQGAVQDDVLCAVCGHSFGCDVKSVLRSKDICASLRRVELKHGHKFCVCHMCFDCAHAMAEKTPHGHCC